MLDHIEVFHLLDWIQNSLVSENPDARERLKSRSSSALFAILGSSQDNLTRVICYKAGFLRDFQGSCVWYELVLWQVQCKLPFVVGLCTRLQVRRVALIWKINCTVSNSTMDWAGGAASVPAALSGNKGWWIILTVTPRGLQYKAPVGSVLAVLVTSRKSAAHQCYIFPIVKGVYMQCDSQLWLGRSWLVRRDEG